MTSNDAENRIFVSHVPQGASIEDLIAHFSQFGTTSDVYVPRVFGTNEHKGIAYVSFDFADSKDQALQSPGHIILGQQVLVQVCLPKGGSGKGCKGALPGSTNDGDRVFISQIPEDALQEEVQAYFAQFGAWSDIYMPKGKYTAGHKGICFITYSNPVSVTQVLQTQPHHVNGQQVVVDIAAPRDVVKGAGKGADMVIAPAAPAQIFVPRPSVAVARPRPAWPAAAVQPRPQQQPAGAVLPGRLFLTKVSPTITQDDLTAYFQTFGTLNDVYIPAGGKGIAFVGFDDPSVAVVVAEMAQHEVKQGCLVIVDQAIDRAGPGKGHGKQRFQPY